MTWLIIGGGISGLGAAKLLRSRGESVRVTDAKKLGDDRRRPFLDLGVDLQDGTESQKVLTGVHTLVLSPGVPPSNPLVLSGEQRGLKIMTEIDLGLKHFNEKGGKLIAITGTNGKSTICVMTEHILSRAGYRVTAGGNLGDPLTAMIAEGRSREYLVLELSSYQLELSRFVQPEVAGITSFSYDHQGRHKTLENYFHAKWNIFNQIRQSGTAILPSSIYETAKRLDCPEIKGQRYIIQTEDGGPVGGCTGFESLDKTPLKNSLKDSQTQFFRIKMGQKRVFNENEQEIANLSKFHLGQKHNIYNAVFSSLAVSALTKENLSNLIGYLSDFRGLPHRCELVGHINGEPVINDSKSTNVESTMVAVASQEKPVLLMLGGEGKGESFEPLTKFFSNVAAVIIFGASGNKIASDLRSAFKPECAPMQYTFRTLAEALAAVPDMLARKKVPLLFSPGCASFDEFRNFEDRGQFFSRVLQPLFDETDDI